MSEKKKSAFLNDWWRQFLTGVMGTAIGVGLTFAVSNMVENHNKAQVRRQTATMVVYDIDEMIQSVGAELGVYHVDAALLQIGHDLVYAAVGVHVHDL